MLALFGRPIFGVAMPCMGMLVFRTVVILLSCCVVLAGGGSIFQVTASDLFCQMPNPKHDAHSRPTLTTNNQKTEDYAGRLMAGIVMNALSIRLLETQHPAQEPSQAAQQAGQCPLCQQICNAAPQVRRVLIRLNYKALERPGLTSEERVQDAVQAVMNQISDDTKTTVLATLCEHHAN